jgi:hypothetical protein
MKEEIEITKETKYVVVEAATKWQKGQEVITGLLLGPHVYKGYHFLFLYGDDGKTYALNTDNYGIVSIRAENKENETLLVFTNEEPDQTKALKIINTIFDNLIKKGFGRNNGDLVNYMAYETKSKQYTPAFKRAETVNKTHTHTTKTTHNTIYSSSNAINKPKKEPFFFQRKKVPDKSVLKQMVTKVDAVIDGGSIPQIPELKVESYTYGNGWKGRYMT